jgi:DNA mismatch repair ATPase MutL
VALEAARRGELGPPQRLLVPAELELPGGDRARLDEVREALASLGLELRAREDRVSVHAVPASAKGVDPRELVTAALEAHAEDRDLEAALSAVVRGAASPGGRARRAPFSAEEGAYLIAALERCEIRDRAPDGRPLVVALSSAQLRSLFGGAA